MTRPNLASCAILGSFFKGMAIFTGQDEFSIRMEDREKVNNLESSAKRAERIGRASSPSPELSGAFQTHIASAVSSSLTDSTNQLEGEAEKATAIPAG